MVFCFIFHPHMFRCDPVVRLFVSVFQSFPPWMSQMIGAGTEGCESRGQRGGVGKKKKRKKHKISLCPAVWYDTHYLKWAILRKQEVACYNRCWLHKTGLFGRMCEQKTSFTRTCRVAAGAPSSVLIDCNYCSFLANLEVQVIVH